MSKLTPKNFFLHFFSIVTLYMSAIALGTLLFEYINYFFPDPLYVDYTNNGSMRFALATLIVGFPIYLWSAVYLKKTYTKEPEIRELKLRKWLVYFTLFAAALIIVGDLISLLNEFLSGELTIRFFLKILAILFVAGSVFGYYMMEAKDTMMHASFYRIYGMATGTIVFCLVAGALIFLYSPKEIRNFRLDQERIGHLQQIYGMVEAYHRDEETLPQDFAAIDARRIYGQVPTDPETNTPYVYRIDSDTTFTVCATFNMAMPEESRGKYVAVSWPQYDAFNWRHEAGEDCFELTVLLPEKPDKE